MKRYISLLLAVVMLVASLITPISAFASQDFLEKPIMIENTFDWQDGWLKRVDSLKSSLTTSLTSVNDTSSVQKKYNGLTYYGDGKELYTQIRNKLDARSENFTIRYYSTSRYMPNSVFEYNTMYNKLMTLLKDFFVCATDDSISVSSTDGDYSRWSVNQLGLNDIQCDNSSNGYYYTIELIYNYYTSSSEESKVNSAIDKFVTSIRKQNLSDYDILKKVHDYICDSTIYDDDAAEAASVDNYKYAYSAYGALVYGKCVCQGYAQAFYRICKELGYSVRLIYSDVHGWNLINLDGKYYFVDCTWDDGFIDEGDMDNAYYYFLVDYDTLKSLDDSDKAHTISTDQSNDDYYIAKYSNYYSDSVYDYDAEPLMSTSSVSLSSYSFTYNGNEIKPTVSVKDKNGTKLTQGTDYTVSYSSCVSPGKATVKINGKGDYAGMSTKRTYIINPKKMTSLSLKSGSRATDNLTLTWTKPSYTINGYQIQVYKSGAWQTVKTITSAATTSYKVTKLSPSTTYKFRIRSYRVVGKVNKYGEFSSVYTVCTTPKAPTISSLSTSSKSMTLKWKKVTCSGYQIQYSTSSDMKNAKTVNVKNSETSKKISKLKKGKKYYIRIRAYKSYTNSSNKTSKYYSTWSSKKSITIK
jgi:hypothetical protein